MGRSCIPNGSNLRFLETAHLKLREPRKLGCLIKIYKANGEGF